MATVTVVGSGPSGVHFAKALLDHGHRVRLFDVGESAPAPVEPDVTMEGLKASLDDPGAYFLGPDLEAVIQPDHGSEYYGLPPSKAYVFRGAQQQAIDATGFEPLSSWARGGLAQAWTGGCYPFNEQELGPFPFGHAELEPFYGQVASEIGVAGAHDDLARFMPVHRGLGTPPALDGHARDLVARYGERREFLNDVLGLHMGRSRIAVLTDRTIGNRKPCSYLGRCLWGCPRGALYTPSQTLDSLEGRPGFEYLPGRQVRHFRFDADGWVRSIVWTAPNESEEFHEEVELMALAAGTLGSSKIFLESWLNGKEERVRLTGLMDNRQVMVPFLTLRRIGRPFEPESYQYNLIAMGLESPRVEEYVHCLVTTLKTALVHPIIQSLPLDSRTASWVFGNVRAALGLVNVNFHDGRRDDCYVELGGSADGDRQSLRVNYSPPAAEEEHVNHAIRRLKRGLRILGAIAPPGMTRWRPMGASVHYSGTLPMESNGGRLTTDPSCRSRDFPNLWVVDGATFPSLPAKNLTFTLMANARRIAQRCFSNGRVHLE